MYDKISPHLKLACSYPSSRDVVDVRKRWLGVFSFCPFCTVPRLRYVTLQPAVPPGMYARAELSAGWWFLQGLLAKLPGPVDFLNIHLGVGILSDRK